MRRRPSSRDFMGIALDLARLGTGRTSPNPMVGAVIVKDGKVLGTGFHRMAGLPHAEIEAFRSASRSKSLIPGATLYVTLEPCCHHGRTLPCTDAILASGVREVVVGMRDPDPKVSGRGIRILRKAGIRVRLGVLEKECRELNAAYVIHRTEGRPFVLLKAATSLDGKVGLEGGSRSRPRWVTGPEAREQAHVLRDQVDAVLVGVGTVLADNPRLTTRLRGWRGKNPVRIVLDGSLKTPLTSKILNREAPTLIATTASPRHPRVRDLRKKGADVLFCRKNGARGVHLPTLLKELGSRGILSVLVEGGPSVWTSFLTPGLVDRIILFCSRHVLGEKGIPMLPRRLAHRLKLIEPVCRPVGEDLMIEARFR